MEGIHSSLHVEENHSFLAKAISVVHNRKVGLCLFVCVRTHERMHGKLAFVQFIRNSADRDLQ